jgi:hypothetical protein
MRREKRWENRYDYNSTLQVHQTQKVNAEPSCSETVESTSRPLKGVDDVKRSHRLAFRMLSVGDRVADNL